MFGLQNTGFIRQNEIWTLSALWDGCPDAPTLIPLTFKEAVKWLSN